MEDKWKYKRLKTIEQLISENPGYTQYAGSIIFNDSGEISHSMFSYFGGYIYVRKGHGERRYYDKKDHYYLPDWFLPDADPVIDDLFENLLEGI